MIAHELIQTCSPVDGSAVSDVGKRGKAEFHTPVNTEDDGDQDVHVCSFVGSSSRRSHRSCVHTEVAPMFSSSAVFLAKPLFISFIELKARTIADPIFFRSTLSIRLGVSLRNQPTRGDNRQAASQGQQPGGPTVPPTRPACVAGRTDDPDPWCHSNAAGLPSLRSPKPSNAKTGEQKENADEIRRKPLTPNLDQGMNFITTP